MAAAGSFSGSIAICYVFPVYGWCHISIISHIAACRWSEWCHCVVVRSLTPLPRRIGCVVSWTTAGAETGTSPSCKRCGGRSLLCATALLWLGFRDIGDGDFRRGGRGQERRQTSYIVLARGRSARRLLMSKWPGERDSIVNSSVVSTWRIRNFTHCVIVPQLCCRSCKYTVAHKCQRPENPQHNCFKLLCSCGFLGNTTKWNCCVVDVPTTQRKLRWPRSANAQKNTTQQLKTVVLWVFWTLALVGHRTNSLIALRYNKRCYFNVRPKANMSQLNLPHGTDN